MKLAVICPPTWMEHNPLTFHMVLGQHQEPEYVGYYQYRHEVGDFILVDNGVAEGEFSPEAFRRLLNTWMNFADEIVLPDRFEDPDGGLELLQKYAPYVPVHQRMIIPHGHACQDWFDCLEEYDDALRGEYASIGIGRYSRWPNLRDEIVTKFGPWPQYNLHLLGARTNPMEDFHRFHNRVRSIDTGAPVAWTQNGKCIKEGGHYSLNWSDEMESCDEVLLRENIACAVKACHGKD